MDRDNIVPINSAGISLHVRTAKIQISLRLHTLGLSPEETLDPRLPRERLLKTLSRLETVQTVEMCLYSANTSY